MAANAYLKLLSISWQSGLVYRASVFLWRFRMMLATLMSLSIWQVVFVQSERVFGYREAEMTTYIFLTAILQSLVFATALHGLAGMVYEGDLTNWILKPLPLFKGLFIYDLADKLKNFGFMFIEIGLLALLFKPALTMPALPIIFIFLVWTVLAVALHFIITMLFGSLGFWSPDVWAPKFLFFTIVEFTAGKLFPLDILPDSLENALRFTPFPYLSYYQTQLFLGKIPTAQMLPLTLMLVFWCVILGALNIRLWRYGMKDYEATGR